MRLGLAVLVGVTASAACSESHGAPLSDAAPRGEDTAAGDGSMLARDAGPPVDVTPPCPDLDGDGHADVACGGDDCDDGDPRVSPAGGVCTSPAMLRTCSPGGSATLVECGLDAPYCDARRGTCAADACGDGVLHEGEECDDGNEVDGDRCDRACREEPCRSDRDCRASAPSCSERHPDGRVLCRESTGGAPVGSLCEADEECASDWCDLDQGRCTVACEEHTDCDGPLAWCMSVGLLPVTPHPPPVSCAFGCFRRSDCSRGRVCVPAFGREPESLAFSLCMPPSGTAAPGEECDSELDCQDSFCVSDRCAPICGTDADCDGGRICKPFSVRDTYLFPAGWPVERLANCREPLW